MDEAGRAIIAQVSVKAAAQVYAGTGSPDHLILESAATYFEWVIQQSGEGAVAPVATVAPPAQDAPVYGNPSGAGPVAGKFCPKCGAEMSDRTAAKASGKMKPTAPDFACSRCNWLIGGFAGAGVMGKPR